MKYLFDSSTSVKSSDELSAKVQCVRIDLRGYPTQYIIFLHLMLNQNKCWSNNIYGHKKWNFDDFFISRSRLPWKQRPSWKFDVITIFHFSDYRKELFLKFQISVTTYALSYEVTEGNYCLSPTKHNLVEFLNIK